MKVADWVRDHTSPTAVFAVADDHNSPIPTLAGRRELIGYAGWLWTYGLADYIQKGEDDKRILGGDPSALDLSRKYHVDYVMIGPQEVPPRRQPCLLGTAGDAGLRRRRVRGLPDRRCWSLIRGAGTRIGGRSGAGGWAAAWFRDSITSSRAHEPLHLAVTAVQAVDDLQQDLVLVHQVVHQRLQLFLGLDVELVVVLGAQPVAVRYAVERHQHDRDP